MKNARNFLDDVRTHLGEDALSNRPGLGLAVRFLPGYQADKSNSYWTPSALVYPVVDPVLDAHMLVAGATKRGSMSYQIGLGEDSPVAGISRMLERTAEGVVMPEKWAFTSKGPKDLTENGYNIWNWLGEFGYRRHDAVGTLFDQSSRRHAGTNPYRSDNAPLPVKSGVVTWGKSHHSVWFKVYTNNLVLPQELIDEIGEVDLNIRPAGKTRRDPRPVRPAQAVAIADWASDMGFALVDPDGDYALGQMRSRLARRVVAWTRPGRPAQAEVSFGSRVTVPSSIKLGAMEPRNCLTEPASRIGQVAAHELAALVEAGVEVIMPPAVSDMAALASAQPVDDDRLYDHQKVAVGRHVATKVGLCNFFDPGGGKSPTTLEGMRRRAENIVGYRGLVVSEANVRKQFSEEASIWFPEARIVKVEKAKDVASLIDVLDEAGDEPVLVFTSYALVCSVNEYIVVQEDVKATISSLLGVENLDEDAPAVTEQTASVAGEPLFTVVDSAQPSLFDAIEEMVSEDDKPIDLGRILLDVCWNDIVADEAAFLRNPSSKQARAMWALRENSEVAVALTGTPVNRGIDDLGRIIAWVRNDRHMFDGVRLENSFDLSTQEGLDDFAAAIGPIVVRYDKSEWEDQLPEVTDPVVLELEPSADELRLANGARDELRRTYEDLLEAIEQKAAANPDDPAFAQAREALAAARGAWLGGTTLARMAASDPAALVNSTSTGAALLASQGLVQAANSRPGTKRTTVVKMCMDAIAEGERPLIFTEFSSVAEGLIADLEAAGARVGRILGGGGRKRDEDVDAFRRGELDVLVSTAAGERGLNLQTATMLVHYDLPWTPSGIIQRTGRVERIGATAKEIKVIFCVMKGTIEERVVALVTSRAGAAEAANRALDSSGKTRSKSSLGRAVGGLATIADGSHLSGRDAALLDATRILLAS